uniref:Uncharacterized protein n=1 Tax=Noccaea caerulescens TaxID=107243 RepID=A0A1J3JPL9_NOCCA
MFRKLRDPADQERNFDKDTYTEKSVITRTGAEVEQLCGLIETEPGEKEKEKSLDFYIKGYELRPCSSGEITREIAIRMIPRICLGTQLERFRF